jgi:RimJ/RimL family protein N-acetyltransferase
MWFEFASREFGRTRHVSGIPVVHATPVHEDRFMQVPVLETKRLRLRGFTIDDFPACAEMWADPVMMRYLGGPFSREESWSRFMRLFGHWLLMGYGFWTVVDRTTGVGLGHTGFLNYKRDIQPSLDGLPEIGWSFLPASQGRGYATEAARAVLAWGRGHFGPVRTSCIIDPENKPSIRVAERCGFLEVARTTYKQNPIIVFHREPADEDGRAP